MWFLCESVEGKKALNDNFTSHINRKNRVSNFLRYTRIEKLPAIKADG